MGSAMSFGTIAMKYLTERSWSVIPINRDRKIPLLERWKAYQQRLPTEQEIRQWDTMWPQAAIAVVCGRVSGRIAVLDIDDPKLAERVVADLQQIPTVVVRTPSDGVHVYLKEIAAKSRSGPLVPGIADLKSEGGYVLAPPTTGYTKLADRPLLEAPNARDWATTFLKGYGVEVPVENGKSVAYKTVIERPLQEGERDTVLTSYAGHLWREGWSGSELLALLTAVNERRCTPPLPPEQIEKIVASVSRYPRLIQAPPGGLSGVELVTVAAEQEPGPRQDLIEGLVPMGYTTVIYGDGGQGKSLLVLRLAMAVATGEPIFWRGIQQTGVLYLDWELDKDDFLRRAYAIARGMGLEGLPENFWYVKVACSISSLIDAVKPPIRERHIGLIVVDSLSVAMLDDPDAAKNVIALFTQLRGLNATSLAIDHQPKLKEKQVYTQNLPFGSSFKYHMARSVIQVEQLADGVLEGGRTYLDIALRQRKFTFGSKSRNREIPIRLTFGGGIVQCSGMEPTNASLPGTV